MLPENNVRLVSLVYIPIIYGQVLDDGKVLETPKRKPAKTITKIEQHLGKTKDKLIKTTLFECIRFKLDITLNVPAQNREEFNVHFELIMC